MKVLLAAVAALSPMGHRIRWPNVNYIHRASLPA